MTPQDLIAAFEVLAEAPSGVKRLRELVLQLAVRGKLVAQDPADEAVFGVPDRQEGQFVVPENWSWSTVAGVCAYVRRGKSPDYVDASDVPVVSQKCVQLRGFDIEKVRFVAAGSLGRYEEEQFLRVGDLLWNSTGHGTLGRIIPFRTDPRFPKVVADSHVTIVRPVRVLSGFLWLWLAGPLIQSRIESLATGSTKQTELSAKVIVAQGVPVPPLAEQHRIVARVDELMGLLDRLEAARNTREATRIAARDSALAALRDANSADEAEVAWQRIAEQMDALFTRPDDVDPLRQAVLQLAVRGRLVPQNPDDEPASILLNRIAAKKTPRVASNKGRKSAAPSFIDEPPFDVPNGWVWARWSAVGVCQNGRAFPSAEYCDDGVKLIRPGNLHRDGTVHWTATNTRYLPREWEDRHPEHVVRGGELIMNLTAQSLVDDFLGRVCITDADEHCLLNQRLARITPLGWSPMFCLQLLKSPFVRAQITGLNTGTLIQHMFTSQVDEFLLPLAPLAEQHRIVAKVDALMAVLDRFERHLVAKTTTHEAFAAAAVHHLDA